MEHKKTNAMLLTFLLGLIGVGLLIAAFATDHWILSSPLLDPQKKDPSATPSSNSSLGSRYTGNITFGLFRGYRVLNYGSGDRQHEIDVKADLINDGLFNFGLWVTTIIFLALAIVWGLVSLGFTAFNIVGKPIETITGPAGLYLWNGLAFVFALGGALVFVGLFFKDLTDNVLPKKDVDFGWISKGHTSLDYSFFLVVAAAAVFIVSNIVLVVLGQQLICSYSRAAEKEIDNGMILY